MRQGLVCDGRSCLMSIGNLQNHHFTNIICTCRCKATFPSLDPFSITPCPSQGSSALLFLHFWLGTLFSRADCGQTWIPDEFLADFNAALWYFPSD